VHTSPTDFDCRSYADGDATVVWLAWLRRVQNAFTDLSRAARQAASLRRRLARGHGVFRRSVGLSALSGKVGPSELVTVTNAYLGIIAAAVEANGGYVDKFIEDAVMGVWRAPLAGDLRIRRRKDRRPPMTAISQGQTIFTERRAAMPRRSRSWRASPRPWWRLVQVSVRAGNRGF